MTSKLKVDKAIPSVRTGKPLTAETVNRAIARGRRERDIDNLRAPPHAIERHQEIKGWQGECHRENALRLP
jgi:hypothetical protein